jgi:hypothetical protein
MTSLERPPPLNPMIQGETARYRPVSTPIAPMARARRAAAPSVSASSPREQGSDGAGALPAGFVGHLLPGLAGLS